MNIRITQTDDGLFLADDQIAHVDWKEATPSLALTGVLVYSALDEALPWNDDEDGRYDLLRTCVDGVMSALRCGTES